MVADGSSVRTIRRADRDMSSDGGLVHGSDDALVASIATQQHAALEHAYRSHGGAVFGLARRVLADQALAEEVTQEVFLRLWNKPQRFDAARGSLRSFLLADCHGRALDVVRHEDSRRKREENHAVIDLRHTHVSEDVADEVCATAVAREIEASLRCLPADERQPIRLAFYGGKTYREVASLLRTPEGTVKSRIRRGLERLREEQLRASSAVLRSAMAE